MQENTRQIILTDLYLQPTTDSSLLYLFLKDTSDESSGHSPSTFSNIKALTRLEC
jgi:hypothetical protein